MGETELPEIGKQRKKRKKKQADEIKLVPPRDLMESEVQQPQREENYNTARSCRERTIRSPVKIDDEVYRASARRRSRKSVPEESGEDTPEEIMPRNRKKRSLGISKISSTQRKIQFSSESESEYRIAEKVKCTICNIEMTQPEYRRHNRSQHDLPCEIQGCPLRFSSEADYHQHRRKTHFLANSKRKCWVSSAVDVCKFCDKTFDSPKKMELHVSSIHGSQNLPLSDVPLTKDASSLEVPQESIRALPQTSLKLNNSSNIDISQISSNIDTPSSKNLSLNLLKADIPSSKNLPHNSSKLDTPSSKTLPQKNSSKLGTPSSKTISQNSSEVDIPPSKTLPQNSSKFDTSSSCIRDRATIEKFASEFDQVLSKNCISMCPQCGDYFRLDAISKHIKRKHEITCRVTECTRRFDKAWSEVLHSQRFHPNVRHPQRNQGCVACPFCSLPIDAKSINSHKRTNHSMQCPVEECSLLFPSKNHVTEHLVWQHIIPDFVKNRTSEKVDESLSLNKEIDTKHHADSFRHINDTCEQPDKLLADRTDQRLAGSRDVKKRKRTSLGSSTRRKKTRNEPPTSLSVIETGQINLNSCDVNLKKEKDSESSEDNIQCYSVSTTSDENSCTNFLTEFFPPPSTSSSCEYSSGHNNLLRSLIPYSADSESETSADEAHFNVAPSNNVADNRRLPTSNDLKLEAGMIKANQNVCPKLSEIDIETVQIKKEQEGGNNPIVPPIQPVSHAFDYTKPYFPSEDKAQHEIKTNLSTIMNEQLVHLNSVLPSPLEHPSLSQIKIETVVPRDAGMSNTNTKEIHSVKQDVGANKHKMSGAELLSDIGDMSSAEDILDEFMDKKEAKTDFLADSTPNLSAGLSDSRKIDMAPCLAPDEEEIKLVETICNAKIQQQNAISGPGRISIKFPAKLSSQNICAPDIQYDDDFITQIEERDQQTAFDKSAGLNKVIMFDNDDIIRVENDKECENDRVVAEQNLSLTDSQSKCDEEAAKETLKNELANVKPLPGELEIAEQNFDNTEPHEVNKHRPSVESQQCNEISDRKEKVKLKVDPPRAVEKVKKVEKPKRSTVIQSTRSLLDKKYSSSDSSVLDMVQMTSSLPRIPKRNKKEIAANQMNSTTCQKPMGSRYQSRKEKLPKAIKKEKANKKSMADKNRDNDLKKMNKGRRSPKVTKNETGKIYSKESPENKNLSNDISAQLDSLEESIREEENIDSSSVPTTSQSMDNEVVRMLPALVENQEVARKSTELDTGENKVSQSCLIDTLFPSTSQLDSSDDELGHYSPVNPCDLPQFDIYGPDETQHEQAQVQLATGGGHMTTDTTTVTSVQDEETVPPPSDKDSSNSMVKLDLIAEQSSSNAPPLISDSPKKLQQPISCKVDSYGSDLNESAESLETISDFIESTDRSSPFIEMASLAVPDSSDLDSSLENNFTEAKDDAVEVVAGDNKNFDGGRIIEAVGTCRVNDDGGIGPGESMESISQFISSTDIQQTLHPSSKKPPVRLSSSPISDTAGDLTDGPLSDVDDLLESDEENESLRVSDIRSNFGVRSKSPFWMEPKEKCASSFSLKSCDDRKVLKGLAKKCNQEKISSVVHASENENSISFTKPKKVLKSKRRSSKEKCPMCGIFLKESEYQNHVRQDHCKKCPFCDLRFTYDHGLEDHKASQHVMENSLSNSCAFHCAQCGTYFSREKVYLSHTLKQHKYKCTIKKCKFIFVSQQCLSKHEAETGHGAKSGFEGKKKGNKMDQVKKAKKKMSSEKKKDVTTTKELNDPTLTSKLAKLDSKTLSKSSNTGLDKHDPQTLVEEFKYQDQVKVNDGQVIKLKDKEPNIAVVKPEKKLINSSLKDYTIPKQRKSITPIPQDITQHEDDAVCEECSRRFRDFEEFAVHIETDHEIPCTEIGCDLNFVSMFDLQSHVHKMHNGEPPDVVPTSCRDVEPSTSASQRHGTSGKSRKSDDLFSLLSDDVELNDDQFVDQSEDSSHSFLSHQKCGGGAGEGDIVLTNMDELNHLNYDTKKKQHTEFGHVVTSITSDINTLDSNFCNLNACSQCSEILDSKKDLQKHIAKYHAGNKPSDQSNEQVSTQRCHICSKPTENISQHLNIHHSGKDAVRVSGCQTCQLCALTFSNILQFHKHREIKHDYPCTRCKLSFISPATLSEHCESDHTSTSPLPTFTYSCEDCGRELNNRSMYDRHIAKVHGLECTQQGCNHRFITDTDLQLHLKTKHLLKFVLVDKYKARMATERTKIHTETINQAETWISSKSAMDQMRDIMRGNLTSKRHELFMDKKQREQCNGKTTSTLNRLANHSFFGERENVENNILEQIQDTVFNPNFDSSDARLKRIKVDDIGSLYTSLVLLPETFIHYYCEKKHMTREDAENQFLEIQVDKWEWEELQNDVEKAGDVRARRTSSPISDLEEIEQDDDVCVGPD